MRGEKTRSHEVTKTHEEARFDRERHRAQEAFFATESQRHRDVHRGRTKRNQVRHHLLPIPNPNSQLQITNSHLPFTIFQFLSLPPPASL